MEKVESIPNKVTGHQMLIQAMLISELGQWSLNIFDKDKDYILINLFISWLHSVFSALVG